jgi:hypothetical protein
VDVVIALLKSESSTEDLANQGLNKRQKTAVLRFLKALDGVLDAMDKAKNADELMLAATTGGAGLAIAAESLERAFPNFGDSGVFNPGNEVVGGESGSGVGGVPLPGTGPGINQPGGGTVLPGLKPQPKVPVGRTERWTINAGKRMRIDQIYMGKPEGTVRATFGEPDTQEGSYMVYNGMIVRNIAGGGTLTTVLFGIQDGKVVDIRAR